MTGHSSNDAFDVQLREAIFSAINLAHKLPGYRPTFVKNTTAITALLDVVAVYAGAYSFEDYTPEELVKNYTEDLPKRIRQYRKWHQQNDTDIIKR